MLTGVDDLRRAGQVKNRYDGWDDPVLEGATTIDLPSLETSECSVGKHVNRSAYLEIARIEISHLLRVPFHFLRAATVKLEMGGNGSLGTRLEVVSESRDTIVKLLMISEARESGNQDERFCPEWGHSLHRLPDVPGVSHSGKRHVHSSFEWQLS